MNGVSREKVYSLLFFHLLILFSILSLRPKLRDKTCGKVDMDGFDAGDFYIDINI